MTVKDGLIVRMDEYTDRVEALEAVGLLAFLRDGLLHDHVRGHANPEVSRSTFSRAIASA